MLSICCDAFTFFSPKTFDILKLFTGRTAYSRSAGCFEIDKRAVSFIWDWLRERDGVVRFLIASKFRDRFSRMASMRAYWSIMRWAGSGKNPFE